MPQAVMVMMPLVVMAVPRVVTPVMSMLVAVSLMVAAGSVLTGLRLPVEIVFVLVLHIHANRPYPHTP